MKIAFVDQDLSLRTGSRRFTYEVTHQLQSLGHEVKILTTRMDRKECFHEFLSLPVEVVGRRAFPSTGTLRRGFRPHKENRVLKFFNDFRHNLNQASLALRISQKIVDCECEAALLHYHGEHWLLPFFYSLKEQNGAVYLNMLPPMPRPKALPFQEATTTRRLIDSFLRIPPLGRLEKMSFENLSKIVFPSNFLLQQARDYGFVKHQEAIHVPLGVNHSEFYPTGEEEPFALSLGRIHPHKSLELAILAMGKTESNQSLIIAGDIDESHLWYKDKLFGLAEKMKILDRFKIVLHPSESQVVRLMQQCSVFLFPSCIDTFGLVVLEAMACGKPVVACNRGGVPEIVGDAGFLLEPDFRTWQEVVAKLLLDYELRKQMSKRSLERSKLFSWEDTTMQLLSAFNNSSCIQAN